MPTSVKAYKQTAALRQLYSRMEKLAVQASALGAEIPASALPEINILLDLY